MLSTQQEAASSQPIYQERLPWQLWAVIALLSLEGVGNLLSIPALPISAFWLVCKIVFVWGFIARSRVVFVLFCFVALLHVLAFAAPAPFVAFLNLFMVILVVFQYRVFFPVTPHTAGQ